MEYRLDLNNLYKILELVSDYNCKLLPVIKGRNEEDILQLYNEGFREFGENRLNELSDHARFLPEARFHFIAPLQSRKIREIMKSCDFIHTLQRPKEILAINECYENQDIFVQINIDDDPNKSGIKINQVDEFFDNFEGLKYFPVGIMCIPSFDADPKSSFNMMSKINEKLKKDFKNYKGELSMGMSGDYKIALDYGATIIRIGTKIFN